ncbi:hypothetical protein KC19_VG138900 [Ceratodon purpureus]|uniref:Uncharacterized protein n=1 Tax=Ceratodon purpureus TaxID=3225 RepID=A0A8T0HQZ8_CERPU|nr:hypothetical protein KC19_VG138900 [Ceratodon purpureus]
MRETWRPSGPEFFSSFSKGPENLRERVLKRSYVPGLLGVPGGDFGESPISSCTRASGFGSELLFADPFVRLNLLDASGRTFLGPAISSPSFVTGMASASEGRATLIGGNAGPTVAIPSPLPPPPSIFSGTIPHQKLDTKPR